MAVRSGIRCVIVRGMDKTRSLFGHAASLPWLLFLWSAAEILERVEFIAHKMHEGRDLIMSPSGSVILLGVSVLWLSLIVTWPEIKKKLPSSFKFPPESIHSRVHNCRICAIFFRLND
jgi:hypothetical protein